MILSSYGCKVSWALRGGCGSCGSLPGLCVLSTQQVRCGRHPCLSPADLIGYQKPEIQLDSLSDVIAVLYQLNKKAGIRFEIDVQRPPHSEEWSCSLKFKGNDRSAEMNDSLCLVLEEFRDEREKLETYWTDQESFDRWIEKELAYYADAKLQDKKVEVLSDLERIQRRNELDRQMLEKMKKAAEENGDQK